MWARHYARLKELHESKEKAIAESVANSNKTVRPKRKPRKAKSVRNPVQSRIFDECGNGIDVGVVFRCKSDIVNGQTGSA